MTVVPPCAAVGGVSTAEAVHRVTPAPPSGLGDALIAGAGSGR
jgi:hypothetical protein